MPSVKGGLLILETPNIMRLPSRLNFLLTGFHKPRNPFPPYHEPLIKHLHLHSFPVHLPMLDYFLFKSGMRLANIRWNKWRLGAVLLFVVLLPLLALNSAVFLLTQKTLTSPIRRHLFRLSLDPAVLICSVLILVYSKEEHVEPR